MITETDVERMMPVAQKAVGRMAAVWGLTEVETAGLMSGTPVEVLTRTGAALCVWKHVSWRFHDKGAAWMRKPNAVYRGVTPLTLLMSPDLADVQTLRDGFENAEIAMVSGYAIPEYPVAHYACETEDGIRTVTALHNGLGTPAPRADGGPGRFASEAELEAALATTDAVDAPVISYLRDK